MQVKIRVPAATFDGILIADCERHRTLYSAYEAVLRPGTVRRSFFFLPSSFVPSSFLPSSLLPSGTKLRRFDGNLTMSRFVTLLDLLFVGDDIIRNKWI